VNRLFRIAAAAALFSSVGLGQSDDAPPSYDVLLVVHRGSEGDERTSTIVPLGRVAAPMRDGPPVVVRREIPEIYDDAVLTLERTGGDDVRLRFDARVGSRSSSCSTTIDGDPTRVADAVERIPRAPKGSGRRRAALVVFGATGAEFPTDATNDALFMRVFERFAAAARPKSDLGRTLGSAPLRRILSEADLERVRTALRARFDRVSDRKLGDAPDLAPLLALGDAVAIERFVAAMNAAAAGTAFEVDVDASADARGDRMASRPDLEFWMYETPTAIAYETAPDKVSRGLAGWTLYSFNRNQYFERLARDVAEERVVLPGTDEVRRKRENALREGLRRREIGGPSLCVAGAAVATLVLLFGVRRVAYRALCA
jgi:hypothetical protein